MSSLFLDEICFSRLMIFSFKVLISPMWSMSDPLSLLGAWRKNTIFSSFMVLMFGIIVFFFVIVFVFVNDDDDGGGNG